MSCAKRLVAATLPMLFSVVAVAQTFIEPRFYVWHNPPFTQGSSTWDWTDAKFNRMIFINATEYFTKPNGMPGYREVTPSAAAAATANLILAGLYPTSGNPQTVFPGRIMVMINTYGRDASDHDYLMAVNGTIARDANDSPIENVSNYRTRFFYPEDRLDGIGDFNFGFPVVPGSAGDYGTGRTYRHPFIKNTLTSSTNGVYDAPLKQWTHEYADALWSIWNASLSTSQPLPDPSTYIYTFDTEADLTFPNGQNGIHMVRELALRPARWNAPLPGAGGASLANLYDAGISDYAFAANSGGTPGIARDLVGVNTAAQGFTGNNRKYMPFVYERWQHVEDFVMENCAYSTLRARFPGCRVGNYDDYNVDGAAPPASNPGEEFRVGWMSQRPLGTDPNYNLDPPNPLAPVWTPTQFFPRLAIHQGAGGPMWREGVNGNLWYIGMRRKSSGDMESPPLYGMHPAELDWYDGAGGVPGHRQSDFYASGHPLEDSDWEASLRFHRKTAEAVINSCITPGTDCGERQAKFVPWLEMVGSEAGNYPAGTRRPNEMRDIVAMLRGKNLAEGLFWGTWFFNADGSPNQAGTEEAWRSTKQAVDDVYQMRIRKITPTTGPIPFPGGCQPCLETERLEFTLLQGGQPRTIEVISKNSLTPPADGLSCRTEMYVDFEVLGPEPINDILQINVECMVNTPDAVGFVRAGKRQANGTWLWDWAQSEHSEFHSSGPCYYFNAPADASGGLYRNRRTLHAGFPSDYICTDAADGNKRKIRLQLIHRAASPFTSTYDLVQAYRVYGIGSSSSASAASYSSDVNFDGVIDASDAIQFIGEWMESSETTNTNTDHSVDTDDLLNFEEAYATGT